MHFFKGMQLRNRCSDNHALMQSGWSKSKGLLGEKVSGSVILCIIHIGLLSKDYSMLCFITTYTLKLYVENTESSSRGLQRSENPYPKDLGIETALERQHSKTLRAQKKKLRYIWLLHRNYARWKRVHRIRRNTKEMRMKRITLQSFFFLLFLATKQGVNTGNFTGAALFSLWKRRFSNSGGGKAAESLQTDGSCLITWWPSC